MVELLLKLLLMLLLLFKLVLRMDEGCCGCGAVLAGLAAAGLEAVKSAMNCLVKSSALVAAPALLEERVLFQSDWIWIEGRRRYVN